MQSLKDILALDLNNKDYQKTISALFKYLFHRIDQETFINTYASSRAEGLRIKEIARMNGYILKNCKLYAWQAHLARINNSLKPKPSDYGIHLDDSRLLSRLDLNHLKPTFKAFTLQEFDKLLQSTLTSPILKSYNGKFISKKMSFLMKSFGHTRSELEHMLIESAIIAVYKYYPRFESHLHFINVAKNGIHSAGQTFISYETAQVRNKLVSDELGGFSAAHESLSSISEMESPNTGLIEFKETIQDLVSAATKNLDSIELDFVSALAGIYNPHLSLHMEQNNSVAAETMNFDRYMKKVQNYYGFDTRKLNETFAKLKPHLTPNYR